jgi:hypothetical protein
LITGHVVEGQNRDGWFVRKLEGELRLVCWFEVRLLLPPYPSACYESSQNEDCSIFLPRGCLADFIAGGGVWWQQQPDFKPALCLSGEYLKLDDDITDEWLFDTGEEACNSLGLSMIPDNITDNFSLFTQDDLNILKSDSAITRDPSYLGWTHTSKNIGLPSTSEVGDEFSLGDSDAIDNFLYGPANNLNNTWECGDGLNY